MLGKVRAALVSLGWEGGGPWSWTRGHGTQEHDRSGKACVSTYCSRGTLTGLVMTPHFCSPMIR